MKRMIFLVLAIVTMMASVYGHATVRHKNSPRGGGAARFEARHSKYPRAITTFRAARTARASRIAKKKAFLSAKNGKSVLKAKAAKAKSAKAKK